MNLKMRKTTLTQTSEGLSKTIRRMTKDYIRAWNARDLDQMMSFYSEDYEGRDVNQAVPIRGSAGAKRAIQAVLNAFPDLRLTHEEPIIQGERVAIAWTMLGTHRGAVMNIPPTHKQIEVTGISILTVKDAKITQASHVWDVAGLLRSLGLLPDL